MSYATHAVRLGPRNPASKFNIVTILTESLTRGSVSGTDTHMNINVLYSIDLPRSFADLQRYCLSRHALFGTNQC